VEKLWKTLGPITIFLCVLGWGAVMGRDTLTALLRSRRETTERPVDVSQALDRRRRGQKGLDRDMKALKLAWEDTLDRVTRMASRINARARRAEGEKGSDGGAEAEAPQPADDGAAGQHALLEAARAKRRLK